MFVLQIYSMLMQIPAQFTLIYFTANTERIFDVLKGFVFTFVSTCQAKKTR